MTGNVSATRGEIIRFSLQHATGTARPSLQVLLIYRWSRHSLRVLIIYRYSSGDSVAHLNSEHATNHAARHPRHEVIDLCHQPHLHSDLCCHVAAD